MIDTQALREKILDLAMRGKLVPQDPADEPARVLLDRIKAEKEELIKAKKIKRDKNESEIFTSGDGSPYEKFKDGTSKPIDIPYDLPAGWEWSRLGVITKLITKGTTPKGGKSAFVQSGIPFIRAENVLNSIITKDTITNFILADIHNSQLKRSKIFKNDLLITIAGTLGRIGLFINDIECNTNQAVSIVRLVNDKMISPNYLLHLLTSKAIVNQYRGLTKTSAIPNLTLEIVSNTLIPLPPLAEQERIVAKINQLFDLVDRIEREQEELQELSKQLKQKVLDVAMQGKLVPQDPTEEPASVLLKKIRAEKQKLFEAGKIKKKDLVEVPVSKEDSAPYGKLPKGWEIARLSNLGIIQTGTTPSKNNKKNYGGDYPFFKPSDLSQGINLTIPSEKLSEEGFKAARKLHKGSILVNSIGNIGVVALLQINGAFNQQINGIEPFEGISSEFLFWLLQSQNSQRQMLEKSSATTISILNKSKFSEVLIPLAPLLEQQRIAEKIKQIVLALNQFD